MSGSFQISNLTVAYDGKTVFKDFSATFEKGRVNVILGGSGVGKTTLLNAVCKLVPYDGSITETSGGISYIFQKDRLIPTISVYKNLDLVLKSKIKDKAERKNRIENMLEKLEIASECDKLPSELSGGQAQRVSMARAFLCPSEILLMDEPFRAMDVGLKIRLVGALNALLAEYPRTVLFVTHDVEECLLAADTYTVLGGSPARIVAGGKISLHRAGRVGSEEELSSVRKELLSVLTAPQ